MMLVAGNREVSCEKYPSEMKSPKELSEQSIHKPDVSS